MWRIVRRTLLALAALLIVCVIGVGGFAYWKYLQMFPETSHEVVMLDAAKRDALIRLRDENKFGPHDYPPLGYTGAATIKDKATASLAINHVIDAILQSSDREIRSEVVSGLFSGVAEKTFLLETEDRDRAGGYLLEIWYVLGFKGASGNFVYGSYFKLPPGYGEPLPPGWKSPTEPRWLK